MSSSRPVPLVALALLLLAAGCGDSHTGDPTTTEFAPELGVDLAAMEKRESGLYVQDVKVGAGAEAGFGSMPSVRYTLWLANGDVMDSNVGGEPFVFQLGMGHVIKGWDQGLVGMRVGGERRLVIPASLGYGEDGSGPIPGNAVLIFQVQMLGLR